MSKRISRREFLALTSTSVAAGLTATATRTPVVTATPSCTDQSLLSQMPTVVGQRYEVSVPDTLELQEQADWAINALTRCTNPDTYDVYFYGDATRNPPIENHKI